MKRYGDLFEVICSFPNLLKASRKAQRGKRFKFSTSQFNLELEKELLKIQQRLLTKTYQMGPYRHFMVYDPKRRFISAAPYVDRVVHHALCNVIGPIFDRTFIHDSYACRKGKGSHTAVDRFTAFSRCNRYVLKCDVKHYFASIDHDILYEMFSVKIKDPHVLWLLRIILDSTPSPGVPIGNHTSQLFANLYLNGLDHSIKEVFRCRYYLRYMDDLILFSDDKNELSAWKEAIGAYFGKLKLDLHPGKSQIHSVERGVAFLGYKIYPTHRLVRTQNVKRFKSRLIRTAWLFRNGLFPIQKVTCSVQSWLGYVMHADSYQMRRKLFREFVI